MLGSEGAGWESDTLVGTYTALYATGSVDIAWEQISVSQSYSVGASAYQLALGRMMADGSNATHLNTLSGNIGAASTTIELTDGIKLTHGIMFLGGATYDLSNPNHATLDNTGANTVITFDAVGFDTSYVILRLRYSSHTLSGNIGAASTTIELTDGIKLNDGIMFLGGATYDLSNPDHATLDNTGDNTVITFDAVGFDTSYVILRLR